MAAENPLWGQEKIANELLVKLGIRVSPRTVAKYMPKRPEGGVVRKNSLLGFVKPKLVQGISNSVMMPTCCI
jgi:hypothetical protein